MTFEFGQKQSRHQGQLSWALRAAAFLVNTLVLIVIGVLISKLIYQIEMQPECTVQYWCFPQHVLYFFSSVFFVPGAMAFVCVLAATAWLLRGTNDLPAALVAQYVGTCIIFVVVGFQSIGRYPIDYAAWWLTQYLVNIAVGFGGYLMLKLWAVENAYNEGMQFFGLLFLLFMAAGHPILAALASLVF